MPLEVGEHRLWGAALAPADWLLCDGGLYTQAAEAALFAVIGNNYNIGGEPVGSFRVPDFRNRAFPTWWGGFWPTNDGLAEALRVPGTHIMPGGVSGNNDPWPAGVNHLIGGLPGPASTAINNATAGVTFPVAAAMHQHNLSPPDLNPHGGANHYHLENDSAASPNWPPRIGLNVIIYRGT